MIHQYQSETLAVFTAFESKFKDNQHALQEHRKGVLHNEPIYIMADALIAYAKAYKKRFDQLDDYVIQYFKPMCYCILQLCNIQGAYALRMGMTHDSKDNSVVCDLIEKACEIAGIDYQELSL